MALALRDHAITYDVALTEDAEHGVRYTIVGALTTPDGRNPVVPLGMGGATRGRCATLADGSTAGETAMSIRTETATIHEFDAVELLVDLPDARLVYPEVDTVSLHAGDSGVVVSAHDEDRAITVEFFRDGETVAITDVRREQVRLMNKSSLARP